MNEQIKRADGRVAPKGLSDETGEDLAARPQSGIGIKDGKIEDAQGNVSTWNARGETEDLGPEQAPFQLLQLPVENVDGA